MSLVREQVEKIFVITILLDDPDKWMPICFKDDWRRFYKYNFLVLEEERKYLSRFQVDREKREKILENLTALAQMSDSEKELIEHKHLRPGETKPAHLAGVEVPKFPTPAEAVGNIADASIREYLVRWHKEYEFLCGYSHVGLDKLQITALWYTKNNISEEDKWAFLSKEILIPAVSTSYVAAASACTESWRYLKRYDSDLSKSDTFLEAILSLWDDLRNQSLLGIVFWDIHAKDVLPPLIGI